MENAIGNIRLIDIITNLLASVVVYFGTSLINRLSLGLDATKLRLVGEVKRCAIDAYRCTAGYVYPLFLL